MVRIKEGINLDHINKIKELRDKDEKKSAVWFQGELIEVARILRKQMEKDELMAVFIRTFCFTEVSEYCFFFE